MNGCFYMKGTVRSSTSLSGTSGNRRGLLTRLLNTGLTCPWPQREFLTALGPHCTSARSHPIERTRRLDIRQLGLPVHSLILLAYSSMTGQNAAVDVQRIQPFLDSQQRRSPRLRRSGSYAMKQVRVFRVSRSGGASMANTRGLQRIGLVLALATLLVSSVAGVVVSAHSAPTTSQSLSIDREQPATEQR